MANQNVKDLTSLNTPENPFVEELVRENDAWLADRRGWEDEVTEIRQYVYATDTSETTNSNLPFANTTTVPKLASIKTNLTTNYHGHLFPNPNWAQWRGLNNEASVLDVKKVIEGYVRAKLEHSDFEDVAEQLLDDWLEMGICACRTYYVREVQKDEEGKVLGITYSGARTDRLNPLNVTYDITADSLDKARKCVRSVYSIGELRRMVEQDANSFLTIEQFNKIADKRKEARTLISNINSQTQVINRMMKDSGFADLLNYFQSSTVEVLQFYGDYYDLNTDELLLNHRLTVVDRTELVEKKALENIDGGDNIHISVHEYRHGTLAPISPLARIVGMQYKLDKLENLRADVFDQIANPTTVEIGDVERVGQPGAPGTHYTVEEGGDVKYLRPDATVLSADMQQQTTMQLMEEFAGAPRQSVGFRTPGEKTKYEVQLLDAGGNKVFQRRARRFERQILQPVLGDYLELGKRYLDTEDIIAVTDTETQVETFMTITNQMLTGQGQIVPRGASISIDKANTLQNLNIILSSPAGQALAQQHMSGKALARTLEDLADLTSFQLFYPWIGLQEAAEGQRIAAQFQRSAQESAATTEQVTEEPLDVNGEPLDETE